jgi:hypothetical protein
LQDYDFAVPGLQIGYQNLVCAGIEGAAAATTTITGSAKKGAGTAAVTAAAATAAAATAAAPAAEAAAWAPSGKPWKSTSAGAAAKNRVATGAEEPTATTSTDCPGAATIPPGTAIRSTSYSATTVRARETALAGHGDKGVSDGTATSTATGNDEGRAIEGDHEASAPASATVAARAPDGDLQHLVGG